MAEKRPNLGASVRANLLNQSRVSRQPFDLILVRFALERLLYRLPNAIFSTFEVESVHVDGGVIVRAQPRHPPVDHRRSCTEASPS